MTKEQYNKLSSHLAEIASLIPIKWGRIQNDDTDSEINMFNYPVFSELEEAVSLLQIETQDYFKKRWFLWKCSQCDEYLFYKHNEVKENPNPYDQEWDFEFFGLSELRFDLKGTVIPLEIKKKMTGEYPNNQELIDFNYKQQSRGVRNNIQNRLFIIHKPLKWQNENKLRANFIAKANIYSGYIEMLKGKSTHKFFNYGEKKVDIIYLSEQADGSIVANYASQELN